jgi:hypothetical protein
MVVMVRSYYIAWAKVHRHRDAWCYLRPLRGMSGGCDLYSFALSRADFAPLAIPLQASSAPLLYLYAPINVLAAANGCPFFQTALFLLAITAYNRANARGQRPFPNLFPSAPVTVLYRTCYDTYQAPGRVLKLSCFHHPWGVGSISQRERLASDSARLCVASLHTHTFFFQLPSIVLASRRHTEPTSRLASGIKDLGTRRVVIFLCSSTLSP